MGVMAGSGIALVDFRKASKIQETGEFDDYARWLEDARDKISILTDANGKPLNLLDPDGRIGPKAFKSEKIVDIFGEAASFWRGVPQMTMETRTDLTEAGRVANLQYQRLTEMRDNPSWLDAKGDPVKGQKAFDKLLDGYLKEQRKAFNKPAIQSVFRGVTGKALNLRSQLQEEAIGSFKGQVSPSLRVPMGAATGRYILQPQEQARTLALTSLAYDQEMGAATRFVNTAPGQNDSWGMIIPSVSNRSTLDQRKALEGFADELGVEINAKKDYLGTVIDIHPSTTLPGPEQLMAAAERHLDPVYGNVEIEVIPRRREGLVLNGAKEYQPHVADAFDESLTGIRQKLDDAIAKQQAMKKDPASPSWKN